MTTEYRKDQDVQRFYPGRDFVGQPWKRRLHRDKKGDAMGTVLKNRCFRKCLFPLLLCLVLLPLSAGASGRWITLTEDAVPDYLVFDDEYSGTVTVTFLGDCTLGGEEKSRNSSLGFVNRVKQAGLASPLREMSRLTQYDDLTVANLECVLTDRSLKKTEKKYNFSGPAAYTEILTSAGVDCVTLANNHSHDYGEAGYSDTKAALESAGVGWFGTDAPAVWVSGSDLMIGFIGVSYSLSGSRYENYLRQAEMLKSYGCAVIITVMHAGTEYSYSAPDALQRQIVSRAAECGSCLIVGHHPHVVQGYDIVNGVPVVYSLGNCSFGGTTHARDSDALVLQAVLTFEESVLKEISLHFRPISITGDDRYNDYAPCFLSGTDAQRVLDKMKRSTGMDPGMWNEDTGAVVTVPFPSLPD